MTLIPTVIGQCHRSGRNGTTLDVSLKIDKTSEGQKVAQLKIPKDINFYGIIKGSLKFNCK